MLKKTTFVLLIALLTSASIFVHSVYANGFKEIQKILASETESSDNFGQSVSVSGDYAIVGAWGKDGIGNYHGGVAYIFKKDQGGTDNWGQVTKLTANDAGAFEYFGYSVSISGDYAVVGAYWKNAVFSNAGAAYIFYKDQDGVNNWGGSPPAGKFNRTFDGFGAGVREKHTLVASYFL